MTRDAKYLIQRRQRFLGRLHSSLPRSFPEYLSHPRTRSASCPLRECTHNGRPVRPTRDPPAICLHSRNPAALVCPKRHTKWFFFPQFRLRRDEQNGGGGSCHARARGHSLPRSVEPAATTRGRRRLAPGLCKTLASGRRLSLEIRRRQEAAPAGFHEHLRPSNQRRIGAAAAWGVQRWLVLPHDPSGGKQPPCGRASKAPATPATASSCDSRGAARTAPACSSGPDELGSHWGGRRHLDSGSARRVVARNGAPTINGGSAGSGSVGIHAGSSSGILCRQSSSKGFPYARQGADASKGNGEAKQNHATRRPDGLRRSQQRHRGVDLCRHLRVEFTSRQDRRVRRRWGASQPFRCLSRHAANRVPPQAATTSRYT